MTQTYTVRSGDTLAKIAATIYGNESFFKRLADYNGIRNPNLIRVGQVIETPSKTRLQAGNGQSSSQDLAPYSISIPNGLSEILAEFGDIYGFIGDDGSLKSDWESKYITNAPLAFPLKLSWDPDKMVNRVRCHRKISQVLSDTFSAILEAELQPFVTTYGGCFNFRPKRTSNKLSAHSWGIAIDLNPDSNPMGKPGDMDSKVVDIFRRFGFKWGGDWTGNCRDPMHFQLCTGY